MGAARPAVFLDRDGVINRDREDYVKSWEEFVFLAGALEALRRLAGLGLPVVVVSNQAAIARGVVDRSVVDEIHARMVASVRAAGGQIDEVLFCPHGPDDACECRKPRPGLLLQAADRLALDLRASVLIGDAANDVQAARAVGCLAILVKTGRGAEQLDLLRQGGVDGFQVAEDLAEAVEWILSQEPARFVREYQSPESPENL
jgi:D-glycero-D-manno-heptose 1,7-bisphosphate phosphatase